MPREEVNYFGSDMVFPDDEGKSERFPFENPDDEQLSFSDEFDDALPQGGAMPQYFTRGNVLRGAWVEIDTEAIRHNIRLAKKAIGPRKQFCAVVKADAYGHGAIPCAKLAIEEGADYLAVATVEEGIELRQAGIKANILILSQPPQRAIPYIIMHRLTPAVCTTDFALAYAETADKMNKPAPFHLAVDTGMNRIGVKYDEVVEFIQSIAFHRALKYEGTFTHFATADESSDWDFRIQLKRFNEMLDSLKQAGIKPGIVHAANSASIFRYPEAHFDMVRLGVTMYGMFPSAVMRGSIDLWPAMSVKAQVSFVKEPALGEGVSYGMNYRVAKKVQIATVPIGYADGLRRILSGRFKVLCNGCVCLQVGNICMDQMMIEVPVGHTLRGKSRKVELGDEVVIIGKQDDLEIGVDTMAEMLGTINYEVTCLFGIRLPKIYV